MAACRQITVLRLPPYHCELNPIELVWTQKEEEKMWELDNLIDVVVEPLIINLGDEDSLSDSEHEF
ncbi:hypothetical protein NQ315_015238 [Exocentrus adspersus]|uniref:Tc1-like transposase DDE domain-containing protein n=1 Tax=Exocentrus adspersus TaxID=1586481 RepID=A0AAV8VC04_9CUCU|nr:hypothetical protein NQ315_015238 [Exocentrus adspersus]